MVEAESLWESVGGSTFLFISLGARRLLYNFINTIFIPLVHCCLIRCVT